MALSSKASSTSLPPWWGSCLSSYRTPFFPAASRQDRGQYGDQRYDDGGYPTDDEEPLPAPLLYCGLAQLVHAVPVSLLASAFI